MTSIIEQSIMDKITTYDGTIATRKDCRFIKGAFYLKNKQCFYIDGKWYRINSDYVVFDYEVQSWVLKNDNLVYGIVDIKLDGTFLKGHFSKNMETNSRLYTEQQFMPIISVEIFRNNALIKEGVNGHYYITNEKNIPREFTTKLKPKKDGFYSFPFYYGSDELIPEFSNEFRKHVNPIKLLSDAYKQIEEFTFGIEFESSLGAIPEKHLKKNGLIACRDGSIAGFEYTTIPLQGYSGIQCIKTVTKLLQQYCSCSPNESLHIHIGGYPRKVKEIASLYKLSLLIEDEIYSMFPYFYVNTAEFKRKSYCGPLPKMHNCLTDAIKIMQFFYSWLSGGSDFTRFPSGAHPMDRSGQHKWDVSSRYVWMNVIPIIWGTRGTIEFRCHTPTFSTQKVINWLFIVIAILKYAKKHSTLLVLSDFSYTVSLTEIINEAYTTNISSILNDYIKERKNHYKKKNDVVGEDEIESEMMGNDLFTLIPFV